MCEQQGASGGRPPRCDESTLVGKHSEDLTNRSSQPLAVVISCFGFMKDLSMLARLALAIGKNRDFANGRGEEKKEFILRLYLK